MVTDVRALTRLLLSLLFSFGLLVSSTPGYAHVHDHDHVDHDIAFSLEESATPCFLCSLLTHTSKDLLSTEPEVLVSVLQSVAVVLPQGLIAFTTTPDSAAAARAPPAVGR